MRGIAVAGADKILGKKVALEIPAIRMPVDSKAFQRFHQTVAA